MLFEDRDGNLLLTDEVDELSLWEIEKRGIRPVPKLYNNNEHSYM